MRSHDFHEDEPLTAEQTARVDALGQDQVLKIDAHILRLCSEQWRKVAFLVALAMCELDDISGVPDVYFSRRVRMLVQEGKLESQGDLTYMRYCEVRVPIG